MAYTSRLAQRDSRLANIKLGTGGLVVVIPPPTDLPYIDLPTSLAVAPHSTHLVAHRHSSSVAAFVHRTSVELD